MTAGLGLVALTIAGNAVVLGTPVVVGIAFARRLLGERRPRARHIVTVCAFVLVAALSIPAGSSTGTEIRAPDGGLAFLGFAWLAGAGLLLARDVRAGMCLAARRREWRLAAPVSPGVRTYTGSTGAPLSPASWTPVVYLPAGSFDDAVVLHEVDHALWRDALVHAILRVVRNVFWFSPALWWLLRIAIEEREAAADDAALRRAGASAEARLAYAETLIATARSHGEAGFAAGIGGGLERRVRRLLTAPAGASRTRLAGALAVAGIAFASAVALPGVRFVRGEHRIVLKHVVRTFVTEEVR